jgi:hypothetical protein
MTVNYLRTADVVITPCSLVTREAHGIHVWHLSQHRHVHCAQSYENNTRPLASHRIHYAHSYTSQQPATNWPRSWLTAAERRPAGWRVPPASTTSCTVHRLIWASIHLINSLYSVDRKVKVTVDKERKLCYRVFCKIITYIKKINIRIVFPLLKSSSEVLTNTWSYVDSFRVNYVLCMAPQVECGRCEIRRSGRLQTRSLPFYPSIWVVRVVQKLFYFTALAAARTAVVEVYP